MDINFKMDLQIGECVEDAKQSKFFMFIYDSVVMLKRYQLHVEMKKKILKKKVITEVNGISNVKQRI